MKDFNHRVNPNSIPEKLINCINNTNDILVIYRIINMLGVTPDVVEVAYDRFKIILVKFISSYISGPGLDNKQNGVSKRELWMQFFIDDILKKENLSPGLLKKIIEDSNDMFRVQQVLNYPGVTPDVVEVAYDRFKIILVKFISSYILVPGLDNKQNCVSERDLWMQFFIDDILKKENLSPGLLKKIIEDSNDMFRVRQVLNYPGVTPDVVEVAYDRFKIILVKFISSYISVPGLDNKQNCVSERDLWMQFFIDDILKKENLSPGLLKKIIEDSNDLFRVRQVLNYSGVTPDVIQIGNAKIRSFISSVNHFGR